MSLYKVIWKANTYAESAVEANSPEEARIKALANEDRDFEVLDTFGYDYELESVKLVE